MGRVSIYDTTLRDGSQGEGVNFSLQDKLLLTKRLDDIGVDYIEGGYPLSNPKDFEYFQAVRELDLKHAKICAFGMTRRKNAPAETDTCLKALLDAKTPVVTIVGKTWDFHVTDVLGTTLDENRLMIADSVGFCKSQGREVFYDAEHFFDGYRANPEYALQTLRSAADAGASAVVLCDTNGGTMPERIAEVVQVVKRELKCEVGIHCHNDCELAVANTLAAVRAGATQTQGTMNGIGERCGNVDLVSVIANLALKYGYDVLKPGSLERLTETSRYVYELANMNFRNGQPFVGLSAFAHKGGMHTHAVAKNPTTYEHVRPEAVGNERRILVSELSGQSTILTKTAKYQINSDKPLMAKILTAVQDLENQGYEFEAAEASFDLLVRKVAKQHKPWEVDKKLALYKPWFERITYRVNIEAREGGSPVTEATVRLKVGSTVEHTASEGDGPVNALDGALRKALVKHFPHLAGMQLVDYKVRVVNPRAGTAARVRVVIESRDATDVWGTVGVSENVIEASWLALADSIEYKLFKDAEAGEITIMATELPKAYDAKAAQEKWLTFWERNGYFHSEPDSTKKPYTIVIPPPNVTGALHMGHALNNTLQDVLIRWKRMQGFNALWMPGTDHAGIATQAVVERLVFAQEKKTRHDLGRDELVKRIWDWKNQYEARILGQLRAIGSSCDWKRTRFTLDPVCARAVRETFFKMFRDGYIYRGKRLVNWDTQLQTSVSDDETYTEDTKSGFWTFKYQVEGMPDTFISFSTTRPETMLGDSALCVHPTDERYKHLIGKTVTQPHTGRQIPIIADGILADPTLGTGCVKVTPAHDPNDYACWQRHPEIAIINILNPDGTINENGGEYKGMDRYKAREAVTKKMEELGLYVEKSERIVPMPFSDRSKTPIEPYLSDQWFVLMGDRKDEKPGLAQLTMDAVTSGKVRFFPERYARSYLDWLGEKRDWCISRQLWWGHRIPVWFKPYEGIVTPADEEMARTSTSGTLLVEGAGLKYEDPKYADRVDHKILWDADRKLWMNLVCIAPGAEEVQAILEGDGYFQSEDVLDTWFSSALWPHSTLGWPGPALPEARPDRTAPDWEKLRYYYPTSTLVTSRDIITLWVARMVLTGLYNVGDIPFHHVYITPKVLDGFGEGMSKSKGNGVDPLDIIDLYGTDAMRYGMVKLATETQDAKLPVSNICPHCKKDVAVKQEHMYMRTKKLVCPECKKEFRPGGPWPTDDPDRPTAKQGSDRFEEGRNFANKLWNATRFLLMNLDGYTPAAVTLEDLPTEDRWLLSRLATTTKAITAALEGYRFSDVSRLVYDFVWSEFCDWYIEMSKGRLKDPAARPQAQRVLAGVLDGILRLVQPVMPFVAESLWAALNEAAPERGLPTPSKAEEAACIAKWPSYPDAWISAEVEARFARMQELVRGVREIRNRYQVDDKTKLDVAVQCSPEVAAEFNALAQFIGPLASIANFAAGPDTPKPKPAGSLVAPEFAAYVSLAGHIDEAAEAKRLEKQIADKQKALAGTKAKLANEKFVSSAPAEVVQQQRDAAADIEKQIAALQDNLKELQAP